MDELKQCVFNADFNADEIEVARKKLSEKQDISQFDYREYVDNNGNQRLSYNCKQCGRGKFIYATYFKDFMPCVCDCEMAEQREQEQKLERKYEAMRFNQRQQSISIGYRDKWLTDSDVQLPEAENYIENFKKFAAKNKGLMLCGNVGSGKTFIASVIANELCQRGYKVLMLHITEALQKISKFENEVFIEELQSADLVILDDFGVSRKTDYTLEKLVTLIDTRYAVRKPLIITTNLSRKDLAEQVPIELERTYNRLVEITHPLEVKGESRRMKKAKEEFEYFERLLKGD